MYQRDRPEQPDFAASEALYLRYGQEDFVDGHLALAAIRFPRMSVNRGSLSEPEDVLYAEDGKYNGLGVVALEVSDLPDKIDQEQGPAYVFFMRHVPLFDNYSHSEIWSASGEPDSGYREPSKTVKVRFRLHLSRRISLERIRIVAARKRVI